MVLKNVENSGTLRTAGHSTLKYLISCFIRLNYTDDSTWRQAIERINKERTFRIFETVSSGNFNRKMIVRLYTWMKRTRWMSWSIFQEGLTCLRIYFGLLFVDINLRDINWSQSVMIKPCSHEIPLKRLSRKWPRCYIKCQSGSRQ